jgi:hypothetical protein
LCGGSAPPIWPQSYYTIGYGGSANFANPPDHTRDVPFWESDYFPWAVTVIVLASAVLAYLVAWVAATRLAPRQDR